MPAKGHAPAARGVAAAATVGANEPAANIPAQQAAEIPHEGEAPAQQDNQQPAVQAAEGQIPAAAVPQDEGEPEPLVLWRTAQPTGSLPAVTDKFLKNDMIPVVAPHPHVC